MKLTLFVTDNCNACERTKKQVAEVIKDFKEVSLIIENITNTNVRNIIIVPALYVDEELYSYGDINNEKLLNLIKSTV